MKKTPLYRVHKYLSAKFTEFGGWEMPLQYSSIVKEHLAVRSAAGLFDLSHMGEIDIRGHGANELVQKLSTNDAGRLTDGRVLYTLFCNKTGGIIDDLLIYRYADNHYMLVVNAANIEKDMAWIETQNSMAAEIADQSDNTALIALQGPKSINILNAFVTEHDVSEIPFFGFVVAEVDEIPTLISRTGYTGENGFELYVNARRAKDLWEVLYPAVIEAEGQPVGLGARDTLRLEAGLRLYDVDMNTDTNPFEVGLGKFVKFKNRKFIGKNALVTQRRKGPVRQLIGFQMLDRAVARTGYAVYRDGKQIGNVTSGAPSPSLKRNIGLAAVTAQLMPDDGEIDIEIRDRIHPAKIVNVPFI